MEALTQNVKVWSRRFEVPFTGADYRAVAERLGMDPQSRATALAIVAGNVLKDKVPADHRCAAARVAGYVARDIAYGGYVEGNVSDVVSHYITTDTVCYTALIEEFALDALAKRNGEKSRPPSLTNIILAQVRGR